MKEWIVGRNPVYEVLRSSRRQVFELRMARGVNMEGVLLDIQESARQLNIPTRFVSRQEMDNLGSGHQGAALQVNAYPYAEIDAILDRAKNLMEPLFVLLLDVLKDPQNVGTLIRTAEAVGVHGVILPYRRTATITPAVVSASSGATEHLLICQANLAQSISLLKDHGGWVVGLEKSPDSQPSHKIDLSGPIAVVVGSEGEGMRRLVRESCDFIMELPMRGKISSLNAAVAGSVALYRVLEARQENPHSRV